MCVNYVSQTEVFVTQQRYSEKLPGSLVLCGCHGEQSWGLPRRKSKCDGQRLVLRLSFRLLILLHFLMIYILIFFSLQGKVPVKVDPKRYWHAEFNQCGSWAAALWGNLRGCTRHLWVCTGASVLSLVSEQERIFPSGVGFISSPTVEDADCWQICLQQILGSQV